NWGAIDGPRVFSNWPRSLRVWVVTGCSWRVWSPAGVSTGHGGLVEGEDDRDSREHERGGASDQFAAASAPSGPLLRFEIGIAPLVRFERDRIIDQVPVAPG